MGGDTGHPVLGPNIECLASPARLTRAAPALAARAPRSSGPQSAIYFSAPYHLPHLASASAQSAVGQNGSSV